MQTNFWVIRHALVEENARMRIYGDNDVELCPHTLTAQEPMYAALARRLPQPGPGVVWVTSALSRTQRTAEAIFRAGYPAQKPAVDPGLNELSFGDFQGLEHAALPARLTLPPHAFWPLAGDERPPGGESMADGILRVGAVFEELAAAQDGREVVVVAHGGVIRAVVAHALRIGADNALHLSVENLSLTRLTRVDEGWRVDCVNELPGY